MVTFAEFDAHLAARPAVKLDVRNLSVTYSTERGPFHAVSDISFEVPPAMTMGLVGESGCGKSTVVKSLMRLLPDSAITSGKADLDGINILELSEKQLRDIRWTKIALITQSAMNSLDPVYSIGDQIIESIQAHERVDRRLAWKRAEELFALVGLPAARLYDYPHQFSGGMRQRAVIAMALSLNAGLLLADEPTTALDPIMQDQIMTRIRKIAAEYKRSMILVTHDIAVVSESCDVAAVMYAGKIVEYGPTTRVLTEPLHPYTMGLKNAFPKLRVDGERPPLISIPGTVPNLFAPPAGCRFASRCPFATEVCRQQQPEMAFDEYGHGAACHYMDEAVTFRAAAQEKQTWQVKEMTA